MLWQQEHEVNQPALSLLRNDYKTRQEQPLCPPRTQKYTRSLPLAGKE